LLPSVIENVNKLTHKYVNETASPQKKQQLLKNELRIKSKRKFFGKSTHTKMASQKGEQYKSRANNLCTSRI